MPHNPPYQSTSCLIIVSFPISPNWNNLHIVPEHFPCLNFTNMIKPFYCFPLFQTTGTYFLIFFTPGVSLSHILHYRCFFVSNSSNQVLLCLTFFKPGASLSHILRFRRFFVVHSTSLSHILHSRHFFVSQSSLQTLICPTFFRIYQRLWSPGIDSTWLEIGSWDP